MYVCMYVCATMAGSGIQTESGIRGGVSHGGITITITITITI